MYDAWDNIPRLGAIAQDTVEAERQAGQPGFFYPSPRSNVIDANVGRIQSLPRCIASVASQAITTSTPTILLFPTVILDSDNLTSSVATDGKLKASTSGVYAGGVMVFWNHLSTAADAAGTRVVEVANAAATIITSSRTRAAASSGLDSSATIPFVDAATAGASTWAVTVYQDSGSTINVTARFWAVLDSTLV